MWRITSERYGWVIVMTLSVTETVTWGIVYYGFPVFLRPMEQDLGASRVAVTGAVSVGLGVSALAALPVGRWIDRHGARGLMTVGSCLATLLTYAWARVETLPALYAVWFGMGVAMAATLYEPAFAVVVSWFTRGATGRSSPSRSRRVWHDLHVDRGLAAEPGRLARRPHDPDGRPRRHHDSDACRVAPPESGGRRSPAGGQWRPHRAGPGSDAGRGPPDRGLLGAVGRLLRKQLRDRGPQHAPHPLPRGPRLLADDRGHCDGVDGGDAAARACALCSDR
jgi:hypothetical protein